jgi:hypothetical protein|tara:strand:+ start:222 stop:530 length:309 start_codon:yes stop_codon:yes gene_type:complete
LTEFEKVDEDKNGRIDQNEWDKLALEDRRHRIDDENAKRDQQRQMIWFALSGMLLYPLSIILTAGIGLTQATESLTSIAGIYFVSVSALVSAFFGFTNVGKK